MPVGKLKLTRSAQGTAILTVESPPEASGIPAMMSQKSRKTKPSRHHCLRQTRESSHFHQPELVSPVLVQ